MKLPSVLLQYCEHTLPFLHSSMSLHPRPSPSNRKPIEQEHWGPDGVGWHNPWHGFPVEHDVSRSRKKTSKLLKRSELKFNYLWRGSQKRTWFGRICSKGFHNLIHILYNLNIPSQILCKFEFVQTSKINYSPISGLNQAWKCVRLCTRLGRVFIVIAYCWANFTLMNYFVWFLWENVIKSENGCTNERVHNLY